MRIGIDFGGVLTETSTPPKEGFLNVPPRDKSYEEINRAKESGDVPILISKAGDEQKEAKARLWLAQWKFDELFEDNVEFCTEQKGKIAIAKQAGITVMVDDTLPQLELLKDVEHRLLFNAVSAPLGMIAVKDWTSAGQALEQIRNSA
jgi:hypothetical protein